MGKRGKRKSRALPPNPYKLSWNQKHERKKEGRKGKETFEESGVHEWGIFVPWDRNLDSSVCVSEAGTRPSWAKIREWITKLKQEKDKRKVTDQKHSTNVTVYPDPILNSPYLCSSKILFFGWRAQKLAGKEGYYYRTAGIAPLSMCLSALLLINTNYFFIYFYNNIALNFDLKKEITFCYEYNK